MSGVHETLERQSKVGSSSQSQCENYYKSAQSSTSGGERRDGWGRGSRGERVGATVGGGGGEV